MFVYCGNNPVSRKDPTGNAFVQMSFDPTGISGMLTPGPSGGSGGVAYAAGAVSSFSSADFTKEVVNSKAYQIAKAFLSNIEVSAGIGMGLRRAETVLEWVGLDYGLSYDLASVTLSNLEIYVDQKFWCGVEADLIFRKFGNSEEGQRAYGTSAWQTPPQSDAIEIFGGAAYLFAGGSFSVSFRFDSFFSELSTILFGC